MKHALPKNKMNMILIVVLVIDQSKLEFTSSLLSIDRCPV